MLPQDGSGGADQVRARGADELLAAVHECICRVMRKLRNGWVDLFTVLVPDLL